jgi:hypothetical protein
MQSADFNEIATAWAADLLAQMGRHPTLRREFADYQSNFHPGHLRKNLPKYFVQLVVEEGWTPEDYAAAVAGVVCQRMKLRPSTLVRCLEDPSLQLPDPRFAKKRRFNNSPSTRRWREKNLPQVAANGSGRSLREQGTDE